MISTGFVDIITLILNLSTSAKLFNKVHLLCNMLRSMIVAISINKPLSYSFKKTSFLAIPAFSYIIMLDLPLELMTKNSYSSPPCIYSALPNY